jgi:hypothetical protein
MLMALLLIAVSFYIASSRAASPLPPADDSETVRAKRLARLASVGAKTETAKGGAGFFAPASAASLPTAVLEESCDMKEVGKTLPSLASLVATPEDGTEAPTTEGRKGVKAAALGASVTLECGAENGKSPEKKQTMESQGIDAAPASSPVVVLALADDGSLPAEIFGPSHSGKPSLNATLVKMLAGEPNLTRSLTVAATWWRQAAAFSSLPHWEEKIVIAAKELAMESMEEDLFTQTSLDDINAALMNLMGFSVVSDGSNPSIMRLLRPHASAALAASIPADFFKHVLQFEPSATQTTIKVSTSHNVTIISIINDRATATTSAVTSTAFLTPPPPPRGHP